MEKKNYMKIGSTMPIRINPSPIGTPVVTDVTAYSQESGPAPFDTIFDDFNLQAVPTYNFWTPDEESNESEEKGNRDLSDVPRYVRISWKTAPDVSSNFNASVSFNSRGKNIKQKFGAGERIGLKINGVSFSPKHLQSDNIEFAANSLSNGFVSPGVLESVVEMDEKNFAPRATVEANLVDEDEYLSERSNWGIPYNEFNSMAWNRKSSVFAAQQSLFGKDTTSDSKRDQKNYVDGQYGMRWPNQTGGTTELKSTTRSISHSGRTADVERKFDRDRVSELMPRDVPDTVDSSHSVKVKFTNTALTGLVSKKRVRAMNKPQHAESVVAVAPQLANLVVYAESGVHATVRDMKIPSFPAPKDIAPLAYIGYVIEKYALENGAYVLKEKIHIGGREFSEYYDCKVKYGGVYRYRIQSIIRWGRSKDVGPEGTDQTVTVKRDRPSPNLQSVVSFFSSEWSRDWATADVRDLEPPNPPDQLIVIPDSLNKRVNVSIKIPYNPQRDINKMTILRMTIDKNGEQLTGWQVMKESNAVSRQSTKSSADSTAVDDVIEFTPENSLFIDTDVDHYQTNGLKYVYSAMCHSRHGETSVLADQLAIRLNSEWKKTGEFDVEFVSCAGVDPDISQGIFATYPERRYRSEVVVRFPHTDQKVTTNLTLKAQERLGKRFVENSKFMLRIESLDNGQVQDVPVSITCKTLPDDVKIDSRVLLPKNRS